MSGRQSRSPSPTRPRRSSRASTRADTVASLNTPAKTPKRTPARTKTQPRSTTKRTSPSPSPPRRKLSPQHSRPGSPAWLSKLPTQPKPASDSDSWKMFARGAVIVVLLAACWRSSDGLTSTMKTWVENTKLLSTPQQIMAIGFLEIVAVALCLAPVAWALELAAGSLFGFTLGVATISFFKCTAASLTFLAGRYLMHEKVEAWSHSSPKFAAIHKMAHAEGWRLVLLMRISPAPAFVSNYGFALTDITFPTYFVVTFFSTLLPIAQNCFMGVRVIHSKVTSSQDSVKDVFTFISQGKRPDLGEDGTGQVFYWVSKGSLVLSLLLTGHVINSIRKNLQQTNQS